MKLVSVNMKLSGCELLGNMCSGVVNNNFFYLTSFTDDYNPNLFTLPLRHERNNCLFTVKKSNDVISIEILFQDLLSKLNSEDQLEPRDVNDTNHIKNFINYPPTNWYFTITPCYF